jgi:hypothetical protein
LKSATNSRSSLFPPNWKNSAGKAWIFFVRFTRNRLIRAIFVVLAIGATVAAVLLQRQHLSGEFEFGYRRGICRYCGAQFKENVGVILGIEFVHTRHLTSSMACLDFMACYHSLIPWGECRKGLSVTRFSCYHIDWANGHRDFFSVTPALKEALCSIAKTNRDMCAIALDRVAHLRRDSQNTVADYYPSLYSTNATELARELANDVLNRGESGGDSFIVPQSAVPNRTDTSE